MRVTVAVEKVLCAFAGAPTRRFYGLELVEDTGLTSGTVYPVLGRLEDHDLVRSAWEDVDPAVAGRPARRYYVLTDEGAALAADVARSVRSRGRLRPRGRLA